MQNQHELSNNHVQFSNRNLLCKFEPPSRKSWIRPSLYHLFYFIYMGQPIWYPVALPIWVPIWDPYRLLAGPDPGYHTGVTGKLQKYNKHHQREPRGQPFSSR